jgi:hypothetical protein
MLNHGVVQRSRVRTRASGGRLRGRQVVERDHRTISRIRVKIFPMGIKADRLETVRAVLDQSRLGTLEGRHRRSKTVGRIKRQVRTTGLGGAEIRDEIA